MKQKSPCEYDGKKTGCAQGVWTAWDLQRQQRESRANRPLSASRSGKATLRARARAERRGQVWKEAVAYMQSQPCVTNPRAVMSAIGLVSKDGHNSYARWERRIANWLRSRDERRLLREARSLAHE